MTTTTKTRTTNPAEAARDLQDSGTTCTLDGKTARISGFKLRFAQVWQLDNSGVSGEWSWDAVIRILRADGKFTL